MRLTRWKLKKYLTRRYNGRLASKLISLFDMTNNLNYNTFYQQVDQIFLSSGISSINYDLLTQNLALKQICFMAYDMNCDNSVCEFDLFSVIKSTDNSLFTATIKQDFMDIKARLDYKVVRLSS